MNRLNDEEQRAFVEAWAEPMSLWLVEQSVKRQYDIVFSSLEDHSKLAATAYARLQRAIKARDAGRVAMAARGMATILLTMASNMEWCCAFAAGARATFDVEGGEMPAMPPTGPDERVEKPFVRSYVRHYEMTEAHRRALIEGQRRAREARKAKLASASGPET